MAKYIKNSNYKDKNYDKLIDKIDLFEWSKQYTSSMTLSMIHRFCPLPEIGYTVICFKASRLYEDDKNIQAIYAIVYIDLITDNDHVYITPRYVCASPTYTSRDGEYRQRFIPFTQIINAKKEYSELWADAESYIMSKFVKTYYDELEIPIIGGIDSDIVSGDLATHAEIFPSAEHKKYEKQIIEWANESRMAIHLLVAAWLNDGYNIYMNLEENHMNYNYRLIIYDEEDAEFFKRWMNKKIMLSRCRNAISFLQMEERTIGGSNYKLGQKITPLTIQEVLTRDVALGVWKEIILGKLGTNLVINGIAPGFPIVGDWMFIDRVDRGLFDNIAMHEKYERDDKIIQLNELLQKARDLVWRDGDAGTADLDSLAKKINETMVYSAAYVTITDVAIVSISEWIGHTIRDIPGLLRQYRAHNMRKRPAEMHLFDTPGIFAKYIFDWIFNFYAMNTRLGALHGDIHLNNITIQKFIELSEISSDGAEIYKCGPDPISLYVVPDNKSRDKSSNQSNNESNIKMFIFDSYGHNGAMIDYSRAIMADLNILRTVEPDALPDAEFVQKRQEDLLMRLFHKVLPDIVAKNENKVKALILDKFEMMHKIAMAADYFNVGDNIHLLLEAEFPNAMKKMRSARDLMRPFPPPAIENMTVEQEGVLIPEIPEMLAQLRDKSREFMITHLLRAINNDALYKEDIPWLGEILINDMFDDYLVGPDGTTPTIDPAEKTLYDVFDINAPMTYSCASPDKYPQKVDEVQVTIKIPENIKYQEEKIKQYLAFIKRQPSAIAHAETMKSRFNAVQKLPIESTWKYENR